MIAPNMASQNSITVQRNLDTQTPRVNELNITPEGYVDVYEWGFWKGLSKEDTDSFLRSYSSYQRQNTIDKLESLNATDLEIEAAVDADNILDIAYIGSKKMVLFQVINEIFAGFVTIRKNKRRENIISTRKRIRAKRNTEKFITQLENVTGSSQYEIIDALSRMSEAELQNLILKSKSNALLEKKDPPKTDGSQN